MVQRWVWMLLAAIGYGVLSLLAIRRRWQKFTAELLLLYVSLSMLWAWSKQLSSGSAIVDPWKGILRVVLLYGFVVHSTVLGMLTSMFVHQNTKRTWLWLIDGGVIVLAMGMLDSMGVEWPAWSDLSTLSLPGSIAVVGWVLLSGVTFLASWDAYRKTGRPLHRNRFRYWMVAIIFILFGSGLFVLLDYPYSALGTLLHLVGTAAAVVALLAHRLPDLSGVVRQVLKQVLLAALSGLIFLGGIGLAQYVALHVSGLMGIVVGAVGIAAVLAVSYPFLRRWMQIVLDRLLFGERYDPQRILHEYSQGISNILDLDVLVPVAVGIIGEAMGVHHGALIVCEGQSRLTLRPVRGIGPLDVEPLEVDVNSPPIARMTHSGSPISQYDLDLLPRFQDIPQEERDWFSGLGAEVYVPIHAQDRLLGILALGAKASGDPFSSGDIALLRTLAGQTAVALENARLVENLRRLNAEITELNQQLTRTNERLTILDKTKSDFISISSHELKTPLTQVKGYADILLEISQGEANVQEAVQQMAEGIVRGVRRLQEVVEAMLDVSLIESQAFVVHPTLVSLRYIVEQVIGSLGPAFAERRQTVTTSGLDELPNVVGDGTRLYQALRNLMINSIKFTPDEGRIDVRARPIDGGKAVEIAIADTGIGIAPEHHDLIFEKFYRVGELNLHSTGQIKFKGAGPGLGLPIARGIVEAHGGRIWVESEGHDEENCPGSTFYIVLPVDGVPVDGEADARTEIAT